MQTPTPLAQRLDLTGDLSSIPPNHLLSMRDVATIVGCPEPAFRKNCLRGHGPRAIRLGKAIKFRACDVRAWLEGQAPA